MHPKALSISVIFLAVLGLHGAPIQNQEGSLVTRDNKHISKPHPAAPPHNAGVHTPAHNLAAHIPAHNAAHTPARNVHSPPHNTHTPAHNNVAHTPTHKAPTAGAACVLHQKRSRLWRRSPGCDSPEGKTLKLTSDEGHKADVTQGAFIAKGSSGVVHHVKSHTIHGSDDLRLVVKTLQAKATDGDKSKFHAEIRRLGPGHLNQLAFAGKDDEGNMHAVMHYVPGEHLSNTVAWKAAKLEDGKQNRKRQEELLGQARKLTSAAVSHHLHEHGLLHGDLHNDNVKFTEKDGKLDQAHLLDWGVATEVDPGSLTEEEKRLHIVDAMKFFRR